MRDNSYITEEYCQKLKDAIKRRRKRDGYINSPEAREKVRLSKLGDKNPTKRLEVREKMRGKRPNFKGSSTSFKKGYIPHNNGQRKYKFQGVDKLSSEDYHRIVKRISVLNRVIAKNGETHTATEWKKLKERHNHTCLKCGRPEPEIKLTEDHIIPLSKGGSDKIENIQPLCLKCNLKKHNRIIRFRGL